MAQGDGQFAVRFLTGGLPGTGWDGRPAIEVVSSPAPGGINFKTEGWKGRIANGQITGVSPEGPILLQKAARTSPTLGSAPEPGAVILFDGSGTGEWLNATTDNNWTEKMRDACRNHRLLVGGVASRRSFQDFKLHLEFRLPLVPLARGQARANSGVYLQNRYEIQILDSFGLAPSKVDCGSIYGLAAPVRNMCLPPLAWQTYDIDFKAARFDAAGKKIKNAQVTVLHNGTSLHDRLELTGSTPGGNPEADAPGPILLQYHGSTVHFRNIWIKRI